MDKGFETLDHISELKIRAEGRTKEELFLNMMRGMTAALRPTYQGNAQRVKRKIEISSQDINSLLVDFLNEVLYVSQVNKEAYGDVKFSRFSDAKLNGEVVGKKVESFGDDIKAVTYHGVHVTINKKGRYTAEVIFDV